MNGVSWWRPLSEEQRLSQGDVIDRASFAGLLHPEAPVVLTDLPGKVSAWKPSQWALDKSGYCHCVARVRKAPALVLTESCQLDKPERKRRVIVAPIHVLEEHVKDQAIRDIIMAGRRVAFVPLPGVPTIGDCYADLRTLTTIDRDEITDDMRLGTMTSEGVTFIKDRLVGFFVRSPTERAAAPG